MDSSKDDPPPSELFLSVEGRCVICNCADKAPGYLWKLHDLLWCDTCYRGSQLIHMATWVVMPRAWGEIPTQAPTGQIGHLVAEAKPVLVKDAGKRGESPYFEDHLARYYKVFTSMWEFSDGRKISTAHLLTDGSYLAIGPTMPLLAHELPQRAVAGQSRQDGRGFRSILERPGVRPLKGICPREPRKENTRETSGREEARKGVKP